MNEVTKIQDKRSFWHKHIARLVNSGMTQKEYSSAYGVEYNKIKQWRYKFTDEFPVDPKISNARMLRQEKTSTDVSPSNNNANVPTPSHFIPLQISGEQSGSSVVTTKCTMKLYLNKNSYIELPVGVSSDNMQVIFTALGVV